jgi:hypothetical protein
MARKSKKITPKKSKKIKKKVLRPQKKRYSPAKTRRKTVKRVGKKVLKRRVSSSRKTTLHLKAKEPIVGSVTHYFPKVRAAVVKVAAPLSVGEVVKIKGHTTDFTQTVHSMQIDHVAITLAKKGDEIGLLVNSRVRRKDKLYRA